jgi:hypothetical protein
VLPDCLLFGVKNVVVVVEITWLVSREANVVIIRAYSSEVLRGVVVSSDARKVIVCLIVRVGVEVLACLCDLLFQVGCGRLTVWNPDRCVMRLVKPEAFLANWGELVLPALVLRTLLVGSLFFFVV